MSRLSIACFLLSILFLPFVLVLLRFTISECDRKSRMADHHPTFAATKAPESSYPTISTGTGAGCFGPFEQLSQEQQTGPSLEAPPPTSSRASSERGSMSRLSMAFFLLSILLSFHPRLLEVRFRLGISQCDLRCMGVYVGRTTVLRGLLEQPLHEQQTGPSLEAPPPTSSAQFPSCRRFLVVHRRFSFVLAVLS